MDTKLSSSLQKTLNHEYNKALKEIVDSDLPALIDGSMFAGIPILSAIIVSFKIGKSVRETSHMRKTARFLLEVAAGKDSGQLQKYIERISEEKDFAEKEIEFIILILDRYFEEEKASLLGKLYSAFLGKKIEWKQFKSFAASLDTIFLEDVDLLKQHTLTTYENGGIDMDSIARLQSVGFIIEKPQDSKMVVSQGQQPYIERNGFRHYVATYSGQLFCNIVEKQ